MDHAEHKQWLIDTYGKSLYKDHPQFVEQMARNLSISDELTSQMNEALEEGDYKTYRAITKTLQGYAATLSSYFEKLVKFKLLYKTQDSAEEIDDLKMDGFLDENEG